MTDPTLAGVYAAAVTPLTPASAPDLETLPVFRLAPPAKALPSPQPSVRQCGKLPSKSGKLILLSAC